MKTRSGFVLPGVLMLVCILILLAATRHYFSRNQLIQAAHGAHYEKAYHLAVGGLDSADELFMKAVSYFNDSRAETMPKIAKAPPELLPILKALLDKDGLPYTRKEFIPIQPAVFKHLQSSWENFATLKVEVELKDLETLVIPSAPGPVSDEREKKILVMLHAEASINGAVAKVCRYREAKLVNILPSILGKFSLYLRQQGSLDNNSFVDTFAGTGGLKDTPLIVYSGKSTGFASLKPEAAADFFESQGWIFLGGDAPWIVGSGPGGGSGEHASGMQMNDQQMFPIPAQDDFSSLGFLAYYSQPEFLAVDLKKPLYNQAFRDVNNDQLFSSRIRISGSRITPTPTNIVGKAIYRWALIQGFTNTATQKFAPFPMLKEPQFPGGNWPGMSQNAAMTVEENFAGDFKRYSARMSYLIEENYNSINLRALKFPSPPLSTAIQIDPISISDKDRPGTSRRLKVDTRPATFIDVNHGNSYQVCRDDGKVLFDGNLSGFEDLRHFLSKAGESFDEPVDFFKKIKNKEKENVISNIYYIKGDLLIDRPLKAKDGCGGMVLVGGNITIQNEIVAPNLETIILISLGGNIRIATSSKIQAGLIALKGSIQAGSSLNVEGILSARDLSMSLLSPLGSRKLLYNPNFDATDTQIYNRGFRFFMPEEGITFVQ
ncbi:MAG: hypothetical protein KKB51_19500 [Candidatus Riflebacteria bacterium]|nr:hypothetical protein [Candidatus Riflebacteria bacterium]